MKFKYIEYVNADNESIVFGRKDSNKESELQIVKVDGLTKNSTKIFSNEVIDSALRVFRGNRLSVRQIEMKVVYQPKTFLNNSTDEWKKKEDFLVKLINFFETTSIQSADRLGKLILTSRNDNKYVIDGVIVESIEESSDGKSYNNYIELTLILKSNTPYIKSGTSTNKEVFNLDSQVILTDFVDDNTIDSSVLEFELENRVEKAEGEVAAVRDGYISNDGIFYAVDAYGEDVNITHNGMFWLTDSLAKDVIVSGSRVYPKFKINGYVVNPKITNKRTNQIFELEYTIEEGQYVIADMQNKTCELHFIQDGLEVVQDIRDFITGNSSWLYLESGLNEVEISFSAAEQETFSIEAEWDTLLEGIAI